MLSRLDYCNAIYAGAAVTLAHRQRVLHSAARLVYELKPSDHVTTVLKVLHWLPIKQRVDCKLCILVHNVSTGHVPLNMFDNMLTACANVPSHAGLCASYSILDWSARS